MTSKKIEPTSNPNGSTLLQAATTLEQSQLQHMSMEILVGANKILKKQVAAYEDELNRRRELKRGEAKGVHVQRCRRLVLSLKSTPELVDVLCPSHNSRAGCSDACYADTSWLYYHDDPNHNPEQECYRCVLLRAIDGSTSVEELSYLDFQLGFSEFYASVDF